VQPQHFSGLRDPEDQGFAISEVVDNLMRPPYVDPRGACPSTNNTAPEDGRWHISLFQSFERRFGQLAEIAILAQLAQHNFR
jgi:hypothetical protein